MWAQGHCIVVQGSSLQKQNNEVVQRKGARAGESSRLESRHASTLCDAAGRSVTGSHLPKPLTSASLYPVPASSVSRGRKHISGSLYKGPLRVLWSESPGFLFLQSRLTSGLSAMPVTASSVVSSTRSPGDLLFPCSVCPKCSAPHLALTVPHHPQQTDSDCSNGSQGTERWGCGRSGSQTHKARMPLNFCPKPEGSDSKGIPGLDRETESHSGFVSSRR